MRTMQVSRTAGRASAKSPVNSAKSRRDAEGCAGARRSA